MAKLTRQAQQIFAGQAPSDMIAAFGSTQTGTPVYSTDLSTLQTTNYQQGWQDAIIADKAPFLEEMNGVQYGLSYQIAYAQQMGIPEWLSTQVYYTGSRCIASDYNVYKSLTDDNTGNNPVVDDGTNWVIDFPEEANVLNYITNCITSALNGVPSYSGTTVTVQEGTNYLFPNGRNSNNSVKNVNFSLASTATGTITGSTSGTYCVFVTSELELIFAKNLNYFISNKQPTALGDSTTQGIWFNPQTNLIYQCAATASTPSWSTFEGAICATLIYDGSTITGFNPIYPVELLKRSDKEEITGWGAPDYDEQVPLSISGINEWATFTAPKDCKLVLQTLFYYQGATHSGCQIARNVDNPQGSDIISMNSAYTDANQQPNCCTAEAIVLKGQTVKYKFTGNNPSIVWYLKYFPLKGAQ